jgi:hypothetical protein
MSSDLFDQLLSCCVVSFEATRVVANEIYAILPLATKKLPPRARSKMFMSKLLAAFQEAARENGGPLHKLEIFVYLTQRVGAS